MLIDDLGHHGENWQKSREARPDGLEGCCDVRQIIFLSIHLRDLLIVKPLLVESYIFDKIAHYLFLSSEYLIAAAWK